MPLASGTKLGPYEIQSSLGAGGMGEVYSARDTRLDRTVAIKILPEHLSEKPEAHARFEREARAISSLNHPNICQLYDVGEQNGVRYIVMEYLQGETLADRLKKGPLPLEQLTRVGAGNWRRPPSPLIATASSIAISSPANTTVLKNKAAQKFSTSAWQKPVPSPAALTTSWSLSSPHPLSDPLTAEGSLVGTYMAPEQVEGKEATASSDIFSFGSVLYEMATGKRAFEGKSSRSPSPPRFSKRSSAGRGQPSPTRSRPPSITPARSAAASPKIPTHAAAQRRRRRAASSAGIATSSASTSQSGTIAATRSRSAAASGERAASGRPLSSLARRRPLLRTASTARNPVIHSSILPPPGGVFDFDGDFSGPPVLSADGTQVAYCAHSAKNAVPFGFSLSIRAHPESSSAPTAEPSPFGRLTVHPSDFLRRQTKNHSCRRRPHHYDRRRTKSPRRRMGRRQRHRLHS